MNCRGTTAKVLLVTVLLACGDLCHGAPSRQEQVPASDRNSTTQDLVNRGVVAYKQGALDQAAAYFEHAKQADPSFVQARLYLAATYAAQYIPGAVGEENPLFGTRAIDEFKGVLNLDSKNLPAIDGIASMLYQMGGQPFKRETLEEARDFYLKHIDLKPDDPEPYYWAGVIDWLIAYRANAEMRAKYNETAKNPLQTEDSLPAPLYAQFRDQYGALVDQGIANMKRATDLRQDYVDAMAYLNLLYRQKADQAGALRVRDSYLKEADGLVERIKGIMIDKSRPKENP